MEWGLTGLLPELTPSLVLREGKPGSHCPEFSRGKQPRGRRALAGLTGFGDQLATQGLVIAASATPCVTEPCRASVSSSKTGAQTIFLPRLHPYFGKLSTECRRSRRQEGEGSLPAQLLESRKGSGNGSKEREFAGKNHKLMDGHGRPSGLHGVSQNQGSMTLGCFLPFIGKETGAQRGSTLVSGHTAL